MSFPALIAIDWGSSSFRAFLLGRDGAVLAQVATDQGIFAIADEAFEDVLQTNCYPWVDQYGKLPIIMSGMVGSRNGWLEAQYQPCPVSAKDLAKNLISVPNTLDLEITIVPGVTGPDLFDSFDVMRGEEVQIFGAFSAIGTGDAVLCMPGTHSKWCAVEKGSIQTLTTFLTGEMFSLISKQSSIGSLITETGYDQTSFDQGVVSGACDTGLLNQLFSIRADALLGQANYACASSYLSGLLIGNEISVVKRHIGISKPIFLVGNQDLNSRYASALSASGISSQVIDGNSAFLNGVKHIVNYRKD